MKTPRKMFNMVEVTLAIAVVGIGIAGIMGLFPAAIQSSRDAIGDNYASDVSNQFLSYIEAYAKKDWTNMTGLPNGSIASDDTDDGSGWGGESGNVYTTGGSLGSGVYGVKCGNDFIAHVKVWKANINDFHYGGNLIPIPSTNAMKVYVEISWPTLKKYSVREKRIYMMELFNQ